MTHFENEGLLVAAANSFRHKTSLSFEDCYSVMLEAYAKAIISFNPSKAKFSTYFWKVAQNEMNRELAQLYNNVNLHKEQLESILYGHVADVDEADWFNDFVSKLDGDTKELLSVVIGGVDLGLWDGNLPKMRQAIRQQLREMGWKKWRIIKVWKTIRQILATN